MEEVEKSFSIKSWAEEDRPREKLLLKGRHVLTDAELIAILIGSGTKKESAVELSKRILAELANNNLNELAKLSVQDLMRFNGIGEAKAISIVAALELGRRRKETDAAKREKIISSKDIYEIFRPLFLDLPHEEFHILLLNRTNLLIKKENVSKGGISGTVVDPKIIFKTALSYQASSIVLCHNHPSGNLKPSSEDISLTKKIKEAGAFLEIPILDHVIITDTGYFSFADEGMM
ncbi:MAG: DNA repair protein RadC [Bacteroidetes bacterium]|nr:DNA repair protein RadC [Bacteroidota bacterium]